MKKNECQFVDNSKFLILLLLIFGGLGGNYCTLGNLLLYSPINSESADGENNVFMLILLYSQ